MTISFGLIRLLVMPPFRGILLRMCLRIRFQSLLSLTQSIMLFLLRIRLHSESIRNHFFGFMGRSHNYFSIVKTLIPEMDLLAFIRTFDPTKVKVGEQQRAEDEPRLLDSIIGRVVPLLPVAPAYAKVVGQGQIPSISKVVDTIVEDVVPLQPRRQRKRKTVVVDVGGSSHRAKKLREDHKTPSGTFVAGKIYVRLIQRSSAPLMTIATIITAMVDPALTVKENLLNLLCSVPTFRKVYIPQWEVKTNRSRLDDSRVCHEMVDEFAPLKFFASIRGMEHDQLFTEFNVGAARQMSLSTEVRIRAEYNIMRRGDKAASLIRLRAKTSKFEAVEKSLQDEVHELEISSSGLQEKVTVYEDCMSRLEKFQDDRMKEVNDKFDKLYADFIEMALHLEEKFYPHLLTTISSCRWLLTHGMELAIIKCLNSTGYLSAFGGSIGNS
ncbi:hypothetical protein Tco_1217313 [Tanacetum coccineum]